jgi:hypothetical protein
MKGGVVVAARTNAADVARIQQRILLVRGDKVVIDADLAAFYGVSTKRLNEQVKRNARRFPTDFAFRLNIEEKAEVVAKCDHLASLKFSKTLPHAFTEHGALMAASVLNTPRAVEMSVFVVRAFVALRHSAANRGELGGKLAELERRLEHHDGQLRSIVAAIRELMSPAVVPKRRRIGFDRE